LTLAKWSTFLHITGKASLILRKWRSRRPRKST